MFAAAPAPAVFNNHKTATADPSGDKAQPAEGDSPTSSSSTAAAAEGAEGGSQGITCLTILHIYYLGRKGR